MDILLAMLAVVAVVTVVGHGIWVLCAAVIRLLTGAPSRQVTGRQCPRCGAPCAARSRVCPSCGLNFDGSQSQEIDELTAAARHVQRLAGRGTVDRETALRVARALLARREEIIRPPQPRGAAPVAPAPAAPIPVPVVARVVEEPIPDVLPVHERPVPPPVLSRPEPVVSPGVTRPEPAPAVAREEHPSPRFVPRPAPPPRRPPEPPAPAKPRRSLANVLAAFMEQRNILWGELVGGLLIVGCSVALVISLWQSLEAVPYFPFLLFTAITAALFGAGEYTLHHWKLESTSRGLLIIALLLTPLNLLVLADPSAVGKAGLETGGVVDFAVKVVALLAFTALARVSGRDLLPEEVRAGGWFGRPGLLAVGTVGTAAVPLLGSVVFDLARPGFVALLGGVALVAELMALNPARRVGLKHPPAALTLIGLTCFATAAALAFLVSQAADARAALHYLGVVLPVAGWAVVRGGGLAPAAEGSNGQWAGGWRTAATAVSLGGVVVMLAGMVLAWPAPGALIAACLLAGGLLTFDAIRHGRRGLHAAAIPCLALAVVTGYHLAVGNLADADLARLLATPESGAVLVGFAALTAALGEALFRLGRPGDAVSYSLATVGAGAFGLLAVTAGGIHRPGLAAATTAACAALALAENLRWRRPALEYAGLGLAVAASLWALQSAAPAEWAAWSFALACESAGLALGRVVFGATARGRTWRDVGVATGALAVVLMATHAVHPGWYGAACVALGAAALLLAFAGRSPGWFAVCQSAFAAAVLFGVNARLRALPWGAEIFDPRSLQAYGGALGLLSLVWATARIGFRSSFTAAAIGLTGFTVDRVVLSVLVFGQFLAVLAGVWPGVVAEMAIGPAPALSSGLEHFYGPGAVALLIELAAVLVINLRERGRTTVVLGLTLLALTVPLLVAGPHSANLATASALRWGLAACYLAVSAILWARTPLARWSSSVGITFRHDTPAAVLTRGLLGLAAAAAVALTAWLAVVAFQGQTPAGPASESFFARIGWTASAVVPLSLLAIALAGHAVRERMPGYASVAGFLAASTVAGGYALGVVTGGGLLGPADGMRVVQLAALTAAAWGVGWMLTRRWLYSRAAARGLLVLPASAGPLLALQIALAVGGNLAAFGVALAYRGNVLVSPESWTAEAGSSLGAAALFAALASFAVWHVQRREPLPWQAPFFIGLTLPALLACAAERSLPGAGYRVLLLAWPGYVLLWSLGALAPRRRGRLFPGVVFGDAELPVASGLASLFTVFVGFKTMALLADFPPVCAAAVVTGLAFAALAVALRSEGLAFTAALCGNVAATLGVCHAFYPSLDFFTCVLPIGRANVVASALAALAWHTTRRLLREARPAGPLLALQSGLGLALSSALLLAPLALLFVSPEKPLPGWLQPANPVVGWPALLLAAAALLWHQRQAAAGKDVDVLGITGLLAGILLACHVAPYDAGNWLSFHVLGAAWAGLGLSAIALGSVSFALRLADVSDAGSGSPFARFTRLFPVAAVRRWVEVPGIALAVLALRAGWNDPYGPYPSAGALVLVSAMAVALALWFGGARHVWASGLLLDLAGVVLWYSRGPWTTDDFLLANALGFAAGTILWTAVKLAWPGERQPLRRQAVTPFTDVAALFAWLFVLVVAFQGLRSDFTGFVAPRSDLLAASAVLAVGVALAVALWDRSASLALIELYGLGLAALAFALHAVRLETDLLVRTATLALAAYVLLACLVARRARPLGDLLRMPPREEPWFVPVQFVAAAFVVTAAGWVAVNFASLPERLTGAAAVGLVVPAVALLGRPGRGLTLVLASVALVDVALALPDPGGVAPWLHRSAFILAALTFTGVVYSDGLPRLLGESSPWCDEARRLGRCAGLLATVALLGLVTGEFLSFGGPAQRSPLDFVSVGLVAVCVLVLMASAVRCALVPGQDPLGLSEDGRMAYVYAAEALVLPLVAHLRLTAPELFTGWLAHYWTVVILLLGFTGLGLSELFGRHGLRVLEVPLRRTGLALPAVPLVAFWTGPPPGVPAAFPQDLGQYAVLWLLVGLLYGLAASARRSPVLAFLSALAVNFGLWSLLANGGIAFLEHPQLWLIPLALIVLVAEHVNRERLPEETAAGLRYLGICMVYVSSTADLFIAGIGNSVVLPVVLAVLAVGGVLAGIVLRVRAFLFPAVSFLLLDVLTMIWHAAVHGHRPWVWWVSGIVLGAAILGLFAVFEKRRNDLLRLIDELKQWN